ncbi:hypothetical protein HPK19_08805 [Arthrobacter citreus]|nr:hypothetical protein HPK19_08805 [Arthrobacter citreus]
MEKEIYIIRHCEAKGQPIGSELTERGIQQAKDLAIFFSKIKIDQIYSSPCLKDFFILKKSLFTIIN